MTTLYYQEQMMTNSQTGLSCLCSNKTIMIFVTILRLNELNTNKLFLNYLLCIIIISEPNIISKCGPHD